MTWPLDEDRREEPEGFHAHPHLIEDTENHRSTDLFKFTNQCVPKTETVLKAVYIFYSSFPFLFFTISRKPNMKLRNVN